MTKLEVLGALLCKSMANHGGNELAEYLKEVGAVSEDLDKAQYKLWEELGGPLFHVKMILAKPKQNTESWTKDT
ncbi:MAG: hypothetical protein QQN63_00955 [Nitrosopumilus sp.]